MPERSGTLHNQLTYHARSQRITYPFSALVGQDEMKLALLLNAVSPQVAGVLVRGEKGTAKSTAVRALQALLPQLLSCKIVSLAVTQQISSTCANHVCNVWNMGKHCHHNNASRV